MCSIVVIIKLCVCVHSSTSLCKVYKKNPGKGENSFKYLLGKTTLAGVIKKQHLQSPTIYFLILDLTP